MKNSNVETYRTIIITSYHFLSIMPAMTMVTGNAIYSIPSLWDNDNFIYNFGIVPKNYIIFLNLGELGVET